MKSYAGNVFKAVLFSLLVISAKSSLAETLGPPGVDQVLSVFASVVKDRANEVALDSVRQQLVSAFDKKTIILSSGDKPVVMYLGSIPEDITADDGQLFFKESFRLLDSKNANLRITDPILLKTINRDFVSFAFRIIFGNLSDAEYKALSMRGISKFSYDSIEMMVGPDPDVHSLGDLLVNLSDDISADFYEKFLEGVTKGNGSVLTRVEIREAISLQVKKMQAAKKDKTLLSADEFREKDKKWNEQIKTAYGIESMYIPVSYKNASANGKNELSTFMRVVGSYLNAEQVNKGEAIAWLARFTNKVASDLDSIDKADPLTVFSKVAKHLDDPDLRGQSEYVHKILKDAFGNLFDTLIFRYYVTPKDKIDQNAVKIIPKILKILTTVRDLASMKEPTPEKVGLKLSALMESFAELIKRTNEIDGNGDAEAAEVLTQIAEIMKLVSGHDWMGLVQAAYDKSEKIDKDNKNGVRNVLSFVRILMQMYQAKSPEEAKQILSASLQDISSRKNRYKNPITIDITCLLGARSGYEGDATNFLASSSPNLFGLYAPLGVQLGFSPVGVMFYPIDLGTYLTSSDMPANDRVNDAVRVGTAVYYRGEGLPVDLGIGADFKPGFGGATEVYRAFIFTSLELPLFMLK